MQSYEQHSDNSTFQNLFPKIVSSPHHQNTFIKSREEKMQIRYYDIKMKINCTDLITVGQLAMDNVILDGFYHFPDVQVREYV